MFGTVDPAAAESSIADGLPVGTPYRLDPVPRNGVERRALMDRAMAIDGVFSAAPRSWDGTVEVGVDAQQSEAVEVIAEVFAAELDAICVTIGEPPVARVGTTSKP